MLRFWLKRGVSGFRIDAVPHLFEVKPNEQSRLPDEPLSGNTKDPEDYGYLKHIFTVDQPETIDMVSLRPSNITSLGRPMDIIIIIWYEIGLPMA